MTHIYRRWLPETKLKWKRFHIFWWSGHLHQHG